ncbi:MAG: hypothetical protein JWN52_3571, partial [Actinomycetia bacterium]|nr:hypothetical protein [Actinomycetes bacterium]
DELPDGWGLMVPPGNGRSRKFRVRKEASVKEPTLTPMLLVEIARRVDNARLTQISELNRQHRQELMDAVNAERRQKAERAISSDVQHRLDLLTRLEDAAGAKLDGNGWTNGNGELASIGAEELGKAFADYVHGHVTVQRMTEDLHRKADHLRRTAERAITDAAKALAYEPTQQQGDST